MVGSGQKVTVVPVRPRRRGPGHLEFARTACRRCANSITWCSPSRSISSNEPGGQGVDHRDPDAVQPAGDLVAATLAELSAGVEGGHHHFGRRAALVLLDGHRLGRDSPTVVDHPHTPIGEQGDVDLRAVAGHRLVDGIVHHLPHQVVQSGRAGRSDVHPGALAHRVETFENGDVLCAVRGGVRRCAHSRFSAPQARPFQHRLTEREPAHRVVCGASGATPRTAAIPRFQCSSVAPRCAFPRPMVGDRRSAGHRRTLTSSRPGRARRRSRSDHPVQQARSPRRRTWVAQAG